jgi:hypothetical protein
MSRARPRWRPSAARLLLALVLLWAQHGALAHAYSHFGLVPDPYAVGDGSTPPAQGCDLGVVHAALDGDPPSCAVLQTAPFAAPIPSALFVTAVTPLSVRCFNSRAPPTRA